MKGKCVSPTVRVLGILGIVVVILTACGLTGSSMQLADAFPGIQTNMRPLLGTPSEYRGDEWGVHTPAALAQLSHTPPFPVVNTNMGVNGSNMLLVHMTGVPVLHVASLVKPPVWGFFFLSTRQALAWYWWIPIFMGFAGPFVLMQTLWKGQSAVNAAVAASFCFSLHSVGFSFWPPYVAAYFCLFATAVVSLRREERLVVRCLYAAAAGWALCGGIQTLYAPWIVPMLTLSLALLCGVFVREGRGASVGWRGWCLPALLFVLCCAAILIPWYLDVEAALRLVRASSYPGGRLSTGGDWPLWGMAKGWVLLTTLYADPVALMYDGRGYNMYPLLFPLLVMLYFREQWRGVLRNPLQHADMLAIIIVVIATFIFQYIGIPHKLARWTLWARSHGFAAEVAIGMGQSLLLAGIYSTRTPAEAAHATPAAVSGFSPRSAAAIATLWSVWILGLAFSVPHTPSLKFGFLAVFAVCLSAAIGCVLLRGQLGLGIAAYTVMILAVTLPFNPLSLASTGITLKGALRPSPAAEPLQWGGRTALVSQNQLVPNFLRAAGVPTLNGVLFQADMALHERFFSHSADAHNFFKYNHFIIALEALPETEDYRVAAVLDSNRLSFDMSHSDFRIAFVDYVVVPVAAPNGDHNPTLSMENTDNDLLRYRVIQERG